MKNCRRKSFSTPSCNRSNGRNNGRGSVSGARKQKRLAAQSVACLLFGVAVTVSFLGTNNVSRNVFVAAAKYPTAFCHIQHRSLVRRETSKYGPHHTLTSRVGKENCRRGGNCLHALDTALPHPRGNPALRGEKNNEVANNVSNEVLQSSGVEAALPLQDSTLIAADESASLNGPNDGVLLGGAALFLTLAFASILKLSPPGCWRYYVAGGICASTSHAITTPIDVVKTRQQVDPWLEEKSMIEATVEIVKQGGPFALLAGLGPTALGYLIEGAVKFGIYEVSKPVTLRFVASMAAFFSFPALDSKILSLILCGLISGTAASFMLSPMEALRIRMVSDAEFSEMSAFKAGTKMVRQEGIRCILKGMPAMLFKQVPYTITKNVSFDLFTTWSYLMWRETGRAITANVKFAIPFVSAMAAAVLSCVSSHPGDMLLSLVNAHEGPKTTRDFAKEIVKGKTGIRGFFVGLRPRFVHVLVIVTTQLLIYDFVKRLVGIAATGM